MTTTVAVCSVVAYNFSVDPGIVATPAEREAAIRKGVWSAFGDHPMIGDHPMPVFDDGTCARICTFMFTIEGRDWCLTLDHDRPRLRRLK